MVVAETGRRADRWGVGAIVIDRRSRIHCCTATRPPGFADWPVEPGRFLEGTETDFDEDYYAALAVDRLAATGESRLDLNTGSGEAVEVHFLPLTLADGGDSGFLLVMVGQPDEELAHTIGNVLAEIRAVSLASQRASERLDHLAFALCRRIDVLLELAHLRHESGDGRLPLDDVVAAGAGGAGVLPLTGPVDWPLLNEQAKAVALVVSDWVDGQHGCSDNAGHARLAARTSDVLELTWTGPAGNGEVVPESDLATRIVSRIDGWLTHERQGDMLIRRLTLPIQ